MTRIHYLLYATETMRSQRLYDRIWFFLTESLLAFTIFRDEFGISFAVMFGVLLFTKCFHWLLSDRIEWVSRNATPFVDSFDKHCRYAVLDGSETLPWAATSLPHTR